ncbi:MAG: hypothetical protein ABI600_08250 [Luteolibacter sp.]
MSRSNIRISCVCGENSPGHPRPARMAGDLMSEIRSLPSADDDKGCRGVTVDAE